MVMLAVDTASAATSVALLDGEDLLAHEVHVDARSHAEVLAVMVERALIQAGRPRITAVACGVGPGAYTGLRVGVSSAQAYALGWDVPVYGVCSLDAMALAASDAVSGPFACAIDARRREIYWAHYESSGDRIQGPFVSAPGAIDADVRQLPWFGEIALSYAELLDCRESETVAYPDAREIARYALHHLAGGQGVDATAIELSTHGHDLGATAAALAGQTLLQALPLYVRRPDAVESVK
ncbi:MAG: tRNA (adenosine(37)-N6)-threonylcarbamoyltransferase complex dimerization subunit type 1 TsaB [Actinomycetota bacterium]|nr:tRNA (adenosine(37)-N6)-threonylcarbamoyltransferase complex dimerization subunit type 1 TsaB [Actinomycetota bacterium]MDP2287891.1 tRNA (adenosine(37)-N6)-threonylcarbamoyltransferase complex dimerization subunit type 1 TsaB [Actinomycetota bacterium]